MELTTEQMVKLRTWAFEVIVNRDSSELSSAGDLLPPVEDQLKAADLVVKFVLGEK